MCGAGHMASAADQSWGDLLSASGCWLAEWQAARVERLQMERDKREALELAAEQLRTARQQAESPAAHAELAGALDRCHALTAESK